MSSLGKRLAAASDKILESGRTRINKRHAAQQHRPHEDEGICEKCVIDDGIAANVFQNIKPMALHDVIYDRSEWEE